jgi:hypothetical protein
MKLSELVALLQQIQAESGDYVVYLDGGPMTGMHTLSKDSILIDSLNGVDADVVIFEA